MVRLPLWKGAGASLLLHGSYGKIRANSHGADANSREFFPPENTKSHNINNLADSRAWHSACLIEGWL